MDGLAEEPSAPMLLLRFHSLGDVVLCSAAARAAADGHGACVFVTDSAYVPIVERMGSGVSAAARAPGEGVRSLRRRILARLDRGGPGGRTPPVDLQGNLTSRLVLFGLGAARFSVERGKRRALVSGRARAGSAEPLRYRAARFLELAGGTGSESSAVPRLRRTRSFAEREERRTRPLRIGLVVGGRWRLKTIPEQVLAEACRVIVDTEGAEVLLLSDHPGLDRAGAVLRAAGRSGITVHGCSGVRELVSAVEDLDLLISPDSGPAHVAAALGVPVSVVFTSTDPSLGFWLEDPSGYGGRVGYHLVDGLECRPCHRHGGRACPLPRSPETCRRAIVPAALVHSALELVQR